jgi:hypothetical protein
VSERERESEGNSRLPRLINFQFPSVKKVKKDNFRLFPGSCSTELSYKKRKEKVTNDSNAGALISEIEGKVK